jgi:Peptidase of plants and bacteria
MPRSTTSAVTDRQAGRTRLAALLIAELICALLVIGGVASAPGGPVVAAPAAHTVQAAPSTTQTLRDGRTARLIGLGGSTAPLLTRIGSQLDDAAAAVTAFWGADWQRNVEIVGASSDAQFAALGGGDIDTAATTTADRIMFAPGAAAMSDAALRIVLRHELFHYAARSRTAPDAPRWLTEGVADYVGRPAVRVDVMPTPPTDAELSGPDRSRGYDRAWLFSSFVAQRFGVAALRKLYLRACGYGHPDTATAMGEALGAALPLA